MGVSESGGVEGTPERRIAEILSRMRNERSRYKSHDLGFVDSVSASSVDDWADELEAEVQRLTSAPAEPVRCYVPGCDGTDVRRDELGVYQCAAHKAKHDARMRQASAPAVQTGWQPKLRAAFTNEVIRAVSSLARQREVCREQDGKAVFVSGMDAAREYLTEQVLGVMVPASTLREHTCHDMNPPFPGECQACVEERIDDALNRGAEHLPDLAQKPVDLMDALRRALPSVPSPRGEAE